MNNEYPLSPLKIRRKKPTTCCTGLFKGSHHRLESNGEDQYNPFSLDPLPDNTTAPKKEKVQWTVVSFLVASGLLLVEGSGDGISAALFAALLSGLDKDSETSQFIWTLVCALSISLLQVLTAYCFYDISEIKYAVQGQKSPPPTISETKSTPTRVTVFHIATASLVPLDLAKTFFYNFSLLLGGKAWIMSWIKREDIPLELPTLWDWGITIAVTLLLEGIPLLGTEIWSNALSVARALKVNKLPFYSPLLLRLSHNPWPTIVNQSFSVFNVLYFASAGFFILPPVTMRNFYETSPGGAIISATLLGTTIAATMYLKTTHFDGDAYLESLEVTRKKLTREPICLRRPYPEKLSKVLKKLKIPYEILSTGYYSATDGYSTFLGLKYFSTVLQKEPGWEYVFLGVYFLLKVPGTLITQIRPSTEAMLRTPEDIDKIRREIDESESLPLVAVTTQADEEDEEANLTEKNKEGESYCARFFTSIRALIPNPFNIRYCLRQAR